MLSVHDSTSVAAAYDSTTSSDFFCKDGRIVRVGDCALFKPTLDSLPLIGIIRQIVERKKENIRLAVNWIYRLTGLELQKGVLLEAAPNEVFFSFHKDEIPAASLLHPCKVAFLSKGVELPSRIASFVCRRVYDIENKCLWWLTDKHYNKEQQEELHKLLDKTRLEMHGAMQSGGRSPKPLNVQTSNTQLKPGPDSVKNNDSSFSSVVKGKKRERGDSGSDLMKEDRISKPSVEGDGSDNMLRSQIGKITERGGLVEFEGVRKLVQLMHPEGADMKIDLVGRTMLADVISVTDSFECLGRFVQLRGLPLLDEWLQEVRRGIFGPKESDKSVDEFLLAVLRALEKLPVNLYSLQTSNVGKSVNYLRTHRNPDIQKKARSLVDTWKKRVEAEMNVIDAKSGLNRAVSSPSKTMPLEVSHVGVNRTGGSSEIVVKSSIQQPSALKSPGVNNSPGEAVAKLPVACPGSSNKLSGGTSLQRKSSNETNGSTTSGVQKEPEKHQKVSPNGAKQLKLSDASLMDHGLNQRLIVRLPNTGRSPARCISEGSVEELAVMCKASSSPSQSESHEHHNRNSKVKSLSERDNYVINAKSCQSKDCVAEINNVSPSAAVPHDEQRSASENCEMLREATKTILSSENVLESGKSFDPSLSSINALIDSCVKFSEVSVSTLLGDDVGMNLLASVAAGEISKSDSSSPLGSGRSSPAAEDPCSGSEAKLKKLDRNVAHVKGSMADSSMNEVILEKGNSVLSATEKTGNECSAQVKPADNSCSVPEGNHSEVTYDASVPLSIHDTKEYTEDEGSNYKRNVGQREGIKSPLEEDEKFNQADDSILKNCVVGVVEAASKNVKVELKNPVDNEQSFRMQRQLESEDGNSKADFQSYSGVSLKTESLDEKVKTVKTEVLIKQEEKPNKDSVTVTENNGESSIFGSATHKVLKEISMEEPEPLLKTNGYKSDGVESDGTDQRHASSVNTSSSSAAGSKEALKLDFDLNEGFPADDESQEQYQNLPAPGGSSAVHLSCPLPFPVSSMSGSFPTLITVAAAAKGPFVHPEHLSRIKGELGWKGSAATSAFRPAEPRKILELPLNTSATVIVDGTTSKNTRPPLDIDLNVSDERGLDDVVSPYSTKRLRTELRPCSHSIGPAGGLDFDLNSVGECPETLQFSYSNRPKLENLSLICRSSFSGGFSNGEMSMSRNFDLNNGPGIDEVATETAPLRQNTRSNAPILSPVPAMTMNHTELGNMASWFPPVNSHVPITIPSFYSSRGEQCYPVVTAAGPQRILVPSVNENNSSFGSEMFRGAVLQSSPAVVFPPTSTFPHPGYPFETSFPVASNHYMDSSSGGAICFPAIPSQLEGSTNVVPSHYPQPFLMGLPGSTASIGHESRKWGIQGLDLNAGPGSSDIPPAYRHISVGSPAQVNKQLHMYQMAGGGLKRKEPDGGWDMEADRYKHP